MKLKRFTKKIERKTKETLRAYLGGLANIINKPAMAKDDFRKFYNVGMNFELKDKVCHYNHLFIRTNGDISPCCSTGRPYYRIANINEKIENLIDAIKTYQKDCKCEVYRLKQGAAEDKMNIHTIQMELSYVCNAKCAMCAPNCPDWRGEYNYYDKLEQIIDLLQPKALYVQGGEVLAQKKSLDWLVAIKEKYPEMKFHIVTNGNADVDLAPLVSRLFNSMTVSVVGFQPETYKKIMELDFHKTERFLKELMQYKTTKVSLKFLITPINIHETALFIDWAINMSPRAITINESGIYQYIRATDDKFWNKIIDRTFRDIKKVILKNREKLISENIKINIETNVRQIFNMDDEFLKSQEFKDILVWQKNLDYYPG